MAMWMMRGITCFWIFFLLLSTSYVSAQTVVSQTFDEVNYPTNDDSNETLLMAGLITGGVGVAMVSTGIGLHVLAESRRDDLLRQLNVGSVSQISYREAKKEQRYANDLDTAGWIGIAVGSAAVVTGSVLVVVALLNDDDKDEASLMVTPVALHNGWGVTSYVRF